MTAFIQLVPCLKRLNHYAHSNLFEIEEGGRQLSVRTESCQQAYRSSSLIGFGLAGKGFLVTV